jgi:hypothetical protein
MGSPWTPVSPVNPSPTSLASNQALKLTRLSGCLLGGPVFGEVRAVRRPCPSPAVQLSAGVRRPFERR